eukprot:3213407-Prymnesium_polylepis.2
MALNRDSDTDELTMVDFKHLFTPVEIPVTETQKEQLFAFCDLNCSGSISAKEFQDGWDLMIEVFLIQAAADQGLST